MFPRPLKGRGTAAQVVGIPGLWADLDVKEGAFESKDAAAEFATAVLAPTVLVDSGNGVHAYWLFENPLIFADSAAQEHAAGMTKAWLDHLQAAAPEGVALDPVSDLARVLRLPGTYNVKREHAVAVKTILHEPEQRYMPGQIEQMLGVIRPRRVVSPKQATGTVDLLAQAPERLLQLVQDDEADFAAIWNRKGFPSGARRNEKPDPSSWCFQLVRDMVLAGFSDQDITDALIHYRRRHEDPPKDERWYVEDPARIRAKLEAEIEQQKAVDELQEAIKAIHSPQETQEQAQEATEAPAGTPGPPEPSEGFRRLRTVCKSVGMPEIVRVVQLGKGDPQDVVLSLHLADGQKLGIGAPARILSLTHMQGTLLASGYMPLGCKPRDWAPVATAILALREYVDLPPREDEIRRQAQIYYRTSGMTDWNRACHERRPFERDEKVWLNRDEFVRWLLTTARTESDWKRVEVHAALRRIAERWTFTYEWQENHSTRSFWGIDVTNLYHDEE